MTSLGTSQTEELVKELATRFDGMVIAWQKCPSREMTESGTIRCASIIVAMGLVEQAKLDIKADWKAREKV